MAGDPALFGLLGFVDDEGGGVVRNPDFFTDLDIGGRQLDGRLKSVRLAFHDDDIVGGIDIFDAANYLLGPGN